MRADGLCFRCLTGLEHPWHDNGTENQLFDWEKFLAEDSGPRHADQEG